MTVENFVFVGQLVFLAYFVGLNGTYLMLNLLSIIDMTKYMQRQDMDALPPVYLGLEPPVSVLAPAHNEERTIVASVSSLLQLKYSDYEILVINDGSTDRTLQILIDAFELEPFPEAYRKRLETQDVRTIYHSVQHPNLRVLDKLNGGKADALNAGINCARYPLYCAVDADSILQRESLERVVQPFLEDPTTVASGGCIRVANGCRVVDGFMTHVGLPWKPLALFQIAEYLRAFLFGRLGWSPLNALLIISGAFGVFNKERVIEAGGYRPGTVGEDMELVVRLHRLLREAGKPYRITFVPDPICWTEVPEDLKTLKSQRVRWQRGLGQSLALNISLMFDRKSGAVGWLAFPFMVIFEWLGPVVEVAGYFFMLACWLLGLISTDAFKLFLLASVGMGVVLSMMALVLEEMSFHLYSRFSDLAMMFLAVILENFGYRQLISYWRTVALVKMLLGGKAEWGPMERSGSWSSADATKRAPVG
ncbi:MAG: glycosyl transferase [Cyanobacteria bacterium RYN_339]|nr:glycosyl transferase [Cyanobacteria bacterium RYN_339]